MVDYNLEIYDLPKVSANKFYDSRHWTYRKKIKDVYSLLLQRYYHCMDCSKSYNVDYEFTFQKRPLDTSNTSAMIKMIEDVLFKNDSYKVVRKISTISSKGKRDCVKITVREL